MQYYSLGFGSQLHGRPVYFDYKRDLLYIAHRGSMEAFYGSFSLKERPDTLHEMDEVEALVSMDKCLLIFETCRYQVLMILLIQYYRFKG
jgi:hypothetical protein